MGSACNNSASTNYFQKLISDTGIVYTGPTITALGICTGDRLDEIEAVLLQKIINYSTGVGISIPSIDLTTCQAFASCITCCNNGCKDLPCLLECYKNAICTIWGDVDTLKDQVDALLNGPYDTGCLTGLPTNPTLNQIIQELILKFCTLKAQVSSLATQVTNLTTGLPAQIGNFLLNALTTCQGTQTVTKSGTGASATISFKGFVPIGAIIPYAGPTTGKFDPSGLGVPNTDVCGFALCNGNNGTVDMREQVPVGCGAGVMGGSTLPSNITVASNYALNALVGETYHTLNIAEIPANPISGTVSLSSLGAGPFYFSARQHQSTGWNPNSLSTDLFGGNASDTTDPTPHYFPITGSAIVTLSNGGGSQKHENRQPSRALLYIQRIA